MRIKQKISIKPHAWQASNTSSRSFFTIITTTIIIILIHGYTVEETRVPQHTRSVNVYAPAFRFCEFVHQSWKSIPDRNSANGMYRKLIVTGTVRVRAAKADRLSGPCFPLSLSAHQGTSRLATEEYGRPHSLEQPSWFLQESLISHLKNKANVALFSTWNRRLQVIGKQAWEGAAFGGHCTASGTAVNLKNMLLSPSRLGSLNRNRSLPTFPLEGQGNRKEEQADRMSGFTFL